MFCTIVTGQNILHVVEYSVCYFICLCADRYLQCDRRTDLHRIDASDPTKKSVSPTRLPDGCRKKSLLRCVAGEILYLANKLITSDQASFFRRSRISVRSSISFGVSSSFGSSSSFFANLSFALFIAWMIRKITNAIMMN